MILIESTFPISNFTQFPLGEKIEVLFSGEVSAEDIYESIHLYGPNYSIITGPAFELEEGRFQRPYEEVFSSKDQLAEVNIEISIKTIDEDGERVEYSDGQSNYKTKVTIFPKRPLIPNAEYKLLITASELEDMPGIRSRSVFDPIPNPSNTGDGKFLIAGRSNISDVLILNVINESPDFVIEGYLQSDSNKRISIDSDGVFLNNTGLELSLKDFSGIFDEDDQYFLNLIEFESLEKTYKLEFSTGDEDVTEKPSEPAYSSPIGNYGDGLTSNDFKLIESYPEKNSSNVRNKSGQVILTFNKEIDPSSVNKENIKILISNIHNEEFELINYSFLVKKNKIIINIEE